MSTHHVYTFYRLASFPTQSQLHYFLRWSRNHFLFNMVHIKLHLSVALILTAVASINLKPVVARPLVQQSQASGVPVPNHPTLTLSTAVNSQPSSVFICIYSIWSFFWLSPISTTQGPRSRKSKRSTQRNHTICSARVSIIFNDDHLQLYNWILYVLQPPPILP